MNIRKTDGSLEEYSVDKVINGIKSAYKSINEEIDENLIKNIADNLFIYENMTSTEIRRLIENALMSVNKKVAREYMSQYDNRSNDINFKKKKSDFIKNYIEASNAATGSKFDANANVSSKNVVTMGTELYKEENIKENRYLLYDRIKMMYSKKIADRYIYDLDTHRIYKHDETAIPGMPYTYSAKEVIEVKYSDRHFMIPFDLLWEIVKEEEVLVNDIDNVYQKYPEDLFVKDINNTFTKITALTKKERKRDLVRVKTSFGEDVVVTDNHPMIVNINDVNDTVEAINSNGCKQYKINDVLQFDDLNKIDLSNCPNIEHYTEKYCSTYSHSVFKRELILNEKFGYFVGFFVGDGNYNNSKNNGSIVITQKNRETLEKLNDILFESLGVVGIIRYKRDKTNCYSLTISNDVVWWLLYDVFMIQDKSENKTLPINILETNENFAKGVLGGLIDADGTINDCQLTIRLSSRSAIVQATNLLRHFGYGVGNIVQHLPFSNNKEYNTNYSLWGVNSSVRNDSVIFEMCEKLKKIRISESSLKYNKSGETKILSVEKIEEGDSFLGLNTFIYDITTETRTFACNNLLVHNCVAITMYPFLIDGLTGLGGQSKAPTDLKSFCGEFINLVYSVSSQFAGAVATPEFLMYFDYFLRKDYGDDYITMLDKKVEFNTKGRTLEQVIENGFQQIIHSMNMPAGNRGYQCVREDTTQLMTPNGFKYLDELKEGDECYVWKDGKLLIEPIKKLNVYDFDGELYQFSGRNYQQTVTDSHRVLYKVPNTNKYNIKEAKDLFGHSKLSLPIGSDGVEKEDFPICDELLKLCIITLTDGSIDGVKEGDINSGRIRIYKSKNRWGYREIPELLNSLGIGYTESEISGNSFGEMVSFTIPQIDSQIILRQIEHTKKLLPRFMKMLSKRQIDIVIDIWSKIDGTNRNGDVYLQCDNDDILNDLQEIVFLGGYGSEIKKVKNSKFDGSGESYTNYVRVFKRKDKRVSEYKKVYYKGRVWCPTTDAGIVVFREENKIPYISGNSVFWNVGYFDKGYFDGVFGEFVFPDGTTPKWETLSWLQKKFMKWFNDERTRYTLTFPVETMACLTDGNDLVDKEYADFTAEMYADGHSFFTYLSDSPDSLSSCCFSKDTKVLWKSSTLGVNLTTLDELHNTLWEPYKKNLRIFHNGSWVKGKTIELPNRTMYKVITENNKEFIMTDNHINVTMDGEKQTSELTTNDYLMFNTMPLNAVPENDEKLTYEQGFVVGAFLGDGSFGTRFENGTIYEVNFSQNENKYFVCKDIINEANRQLGGESICSLSSVYNNVYPLRISSKKLVAFIQKWTNWKEGTYYYNKELNLNCLLQSIEFRKGILDGWYNTDGGNTNRCYTTSKKLIECMEALVTSLGMQCVIDVSDKTDEKVIIRGEEYNRNYPLYCLKWYTNANNRKNKDANRKWIKKNNSIYFKIKSIEKIDNYKDNVYCIECDNKEEPYFTLPCGLITHNCRLRNSLKDNIDTEHNYNTHQFSMGTASVATGSKSVMTINLNRIIQNSIVEFFEKNEGEFKLGDKFLLYKQPEEIRNAVIEKIKSNITEVTENVHKYQTAFNSIIKDFYEANMLDVYKAGFIDMRKQYLTVGVNGLTDAAEFLGIECSDNDEYKNFVNIILETINIANRKDRTRDCMFNTEFVPGENLSNKNYNWDKKDGYFVSDKHIMYSSYFFNPEDDSLSVLEKMRLHGKDYVQYLDGGSACHINLAEHLDKEQNRKLLKYAASVGCNYFTYNVRNTACNSCGYISKHDLDKCPHCGSEDVDKLTRIIGYLKRVKSFAEPRQIEEGMRFYNKNVE